MSEDVTKTASDMSGAARAKVHDLADDFSDTAADYGDRLRNVSDRAARGAGATYRRARATVQEDLGISVGDRIEQQPIEALLLAAAVGYLCGWVLNR